MLLQKGNRKKAEIATNKIIIAATVIGPESPIMKNGNTKKKDVHESAFDMAKKSTPSATMMNPTKISVSDFFILPPQVNSGKQILLYPPSVFHLHHFFLQGVAQYNLLNSYG
ncbi:MAG: hypothetical protein ACW99V_02170 [Candidatus Thorarchaeota archaeon]|jgi:hypothetical protein